MANKLFLAIIALFFLSCSKTAFDSAEEFYKWVNDKDNGYVKVQESNGFRLEVKCLPADYLAYLEVQKGEESYSESDVIGLQKEFGSSKTFVLTIEHEDKAVDPTYYNVMDMPEYKERIRKLNFNMKEHIYIKTDDGSEIAPVLATMENVYQLTNKKTLYLVFPNTNNQLNKSEMLDLVFEDTFLKTGINHFQFLNKDLNKLPKFNFIKNGITN